MKPFTDSPAARKDEPLKKKHSRTALYTAIFYCLMMALYLYFMFANLSSSPKFVYTQF